MYREWLNDKKYVSEKPWAKDAQCLGIDVEVMFPEDSIGLANAKRICLGCPVTKECLDWAVTNGEAYGVWGGRGEIERRNLRERLRRGRKESRGPLAEGYGHRPDPFVGESSPVRRGPFFR